MAEDFVESVFWEEKVLTGGLCKSIKYWVKMDGEAYIREYLRLDGASMGMEAEWLSSADFEKQFSKTVEKEPEEKNPLRRKNVTNWSGSVRFTWRKKSFPAPRKSSRTLSMWMIRVLRRVLALGSPSWARARLTRVIRFFITIFPSDSIIQGR